VEEGQRAAEYVKSTLPQKSSAMSINMQQTDDAFVDQYFSQIKAPE